MCPHHADRRGTGRGIMRGLFKELVEEHDSYASSELESRYSYAVPHKVVAAADTADTAYMDASDAFLDDHSHIDGSAAGHCARFVHFTRQAVVGIVCGRPLTWIAALEGFRALSILWFLAYQALATWFSAWCQRARVASPDQAASLCGTSELGVGHVTGGAPPHSVRTSGLFWVAWHGELATDALVLLSGLLTVTSLLDKVAGSHRRRQSIDRAGDGEAASSASQPVKVGLLYCVRRMGRLWPLNCVAVAFYLHAGPFRESRTHSSWGLDLAFLANLAPVSRYLLPLHSPPALPLALCAP